MGMLRDNGGYEDPLGPMWQGAKLGYTLGSRMGTVMGWVVGQLLRLSVALIVAALWAAVHLIRLFTMPWKK